MKQYWVFALNSVMNIAFCAVDGFFGNSISIDAVVVMGSLAVLEALCKQLLNIGFGAYKVLQKYEKTCCLLSLLSGTLVGLLCIFCAKPITYIFELTETQRNMLIKVLICYGICAPIEAVGRLLQGYITYKCYNKLALLSNLLTYLLMISTDVLALQLGFGAPGLVVSTGITWLVYAVILVIATKFFRIHEKIEAKNLRLAFSKGKDVVAGGIASRAANLCFGHFASTMGTEQYAIHSVALSIIGLAEEFRDAEAYYVIIKLRNRTKHKGDKAKRVLKQCWLPSLMLPIVTSFLLVLFMHGKVELPSALFGVALYCLPMLIYPVYDLMQQYHLSRGKTKYSVINGFIVVFWRVCVAGLLSCWRISVPILGAIYFLDYFSRLIFYIAMAKRDARRAGMKVV